MPYTVDRTEQLEEADKRGYAALKASLQRAGVETRQHNLKVTKGTAKKAAAKTSAKKVSAKPAAKKTVSPAKKASAKPVKKSAVSKKS